MIYDSLSRNDSIVILTNLVDKQNNPLIVAVRPNGIGHYDMEVVPSNFVTSVHGRENIEQQITKALDGHKLLFYDKQKSQELFSVLGLQLSQGLNNLDSNIIIHQSRNIVKGGEQKSDEQSVNIEIEKGKGGGSEISEVNEEEVIEKSLEERNEVEFYENEIEDRGINMSNFYKEQKGKTKVTIRVSPIEDGENKKANVSVSVGNYAIDNCRIMDGRNGLFVSPPSKAYKAQDMKTGGYKTNYRSSVYFSDDFKNFLNEKAIVQYENKEQHRIDYLIDAKAELEGVKITLLDSQQSLAAVSVNIGEIGEARNMFLRTNNDGLYVIDYPKTVTVNKDGSKAYSSQFFPANHQTAQELKELVVTAYENAKASPYALDKEFQSVNSLKSQEQNPFVNAEKGLGESEELEEAVGRGR